MQNIILVGDSAVGKSSFVLKLTRDAFTESYISTVAKEMVTIDDVIIHDTASNSRFKELCREYYKHANAALVFYDVHNANREKIMLWISELRLENSEIPIMIIGNKIDLGNYKEINFGDIKTMYISCKTGENVNMVMKEIKQIMTKTLPPENQLSWTGWAYSYCYLQ